MQNPEQKNYQAIERLERNLAALRADRSVQHETEAIREIGLEIAIAIREVGAMLINVGWEQTYAASQQSASPDPGETPSRDPGETPIRDPGETP